MKSDILSFCYTIIMSILVFLTPIHHLMLAIGAIIAIDFILGIAVARKRGIPITSREAKRTIIKMFLYQLTVLTAFLLDTFFIPGDLVVRVSSMAIGLVEAKSIFENIHTLTGLNIWDSLKEKIRTSLTTPANTSSSSTNTNTASDGTVTTINSTKSTTVEPPVKSPTDTEPS